MWKPGVAHPVWVWEQCSLGHPTVLACDERQVFPCCLLPAACCLSACCLLPSIHLYFLCSIPPCSNQQML
jgi:hypothetical protein